MTTHTLATADLLTERRAGADTFLPRHLQAGDAGAQARLMIAALGLLGICIQWVVVDQAADSPLCVAWTPWRFVLLTLAGLVTTVAAAWAIFRAARYPGDILDIPLRCATFALYIVHITTAGSVINRTIALC